MVQGMSDDTDQDDIEEFFSDIVQSAGGEIESVTYFEGEDGFQVVFKNPKGELIKLSH